ncbi:MAG: hypothetical protein IPM98_11595 [Lewinellaceae bacterium]|nr:hypothetical protein [Lewinellaceae bacterium]
MQQFDDKVKLAILEQVDHNCRNLNQFESYDETLDKRKYSNLKLWITERLQPRMWTPSTSGCSRPSVKSKRTVFAGAGRAFVGAFAGHHT